MLDRLHLPQLVLSRVNDEAAALDHQYRHTDWQTPQLEEGVV